MSKLKSIRSRKTRGWQPIRIAMFTPFPYDYRSFYLPCGARLTMTGGPPSDEQVAAFTKVAELARGEFLNSKKV
jgi:hypothetical protein